jgi:hypothetical protein
VNQKKEFPISNDAVFQIHRRVLGETECFLKRAGELANESSVFWGGVGTGKLAEVKSVYFPQQTMTAVSVQVHPDGVHKMYDLLDRSNEILLAQVHSHPGTAFHSGTDDEFPATFLVGFLSIVVPNFCSAGLSEFRDCAVFVHKGRGIWVKMNLSQIQRRLRILED